MFIVFTIGVLGTERSEECIDYSDNCFKNYSNWMNFFFIKNKTFFLLDARFSDFEYIVLEVGSEVIQFQFWWTSTSVCRYIFMKLKKWRKRAPYTEDFFHRSNNANGEKKMYSNRRIFLNVFARFGVFHIQISVPLHMEWFETAAYIACPSPHAKRCSATVPMYT